MQDQREQMKAQVKQLWEVVSLRLASLTWILAEEKGVEQKNHVSSSLEEAEDIHA